MNSFLKDTAQSIVQHIAWKELNSTTLVLPSHRAGIVLRDEILQLQREQGVRAVWAPEVLTMTQLQDQLSPLYAEDELLTIVRLYRLYRKRNKDERDLMPLDMFYTWGRQMIADYTNIDASMRSDEVAHFFDNTIAAHRLEQWQLDEETEQRLRALMGAEGAHAYDDESIRAQYERLWDRLYDLYRDLHAEMEQARKGYPGMRQRAVLEHWEEPVVQDRIAGRTYVFVGFNYLLPVEQELMMRLKQSGQAMFYWDYVAQFETNEKAFAFAQKNSELFGNELPVRQWQTPMKTTFIECSSRDGQAQYVHQWLQENYTHKGQKVGVVICDETMLEPVIYTLPAMRVDEEEVKINITKGFPLRNTDVYVRVLRWLREQSQERMNDPVTTECLDRLLNDVSGAVSPENEDIENEDIENEDIENEDIENEDIENEALDHEAEQERGLAWQDLLIMESEYQVRKIINQIKLIVQQGIGDAVFDMRLLRLLLRRTMESVTMPFHGEPVTDVQVMGVLETRLLDFDQLLLLNVEEGVLPQRQNDSSFIPFYLRKVYHMQTPDERATVYAYNFFRLLSRTGHATMMYMSAETAEGGKGMSRFMTQILYSDAFEVEQKQLIEQAELTPVEIDDTVPQVTLLSTLRVNNGIVQRPDGTRFTLSASALNSYIVCPYQFYLSYVLGVPVREDKELSFAPNTMGSFVHHAMEYIYRHYIGCDNHSPRPVTADEIEAICTDETKIDEALTAAYEAMNAIALKQDERLTQPPYVAEQHVVENMVIKDYIRHILLRDSEDAQQGLQIYQLEQRHYCPIDIPEVGQIMIGGTVDRIDFIGTDDDQRMRVIDYKSGAYNDKTHETKMSSGWDEMMESRDKGYLRQALLYSHAVWANKGTKSAIEPHLFFCQKKMTGMVTTLDVNNETVRNYGQLAEPFVAQLKDKVSQLMRTDHYPQCDAADCPTYCPFRELCGRETETRQ